MSPWKCLLCDTRIPAQDIVTGNHLRVMHPDYDEGTPDHWPDGGIVFLDDTIEEEFLDPQ